MPAGFGRIFPKIMGYAQNTIVIQGAIAHVILTGGHVAVIDTEDVELVSRYDWRARVERRRDGSIRTVYAYAKVRAQNGTQSVLLQMHRLITGVPAEKDVDHSDGNGLNNRRENMRFCSRAENNRNRSLSIVNTSGFKGVSRHKNKWRARITANGQQRFLGLFSTPEEAAAAYNLAAVEFHGDFAHTNVIELPQKMAA